MLKMLLFFFYHFSVENNHPGNANCLCRGKNDEETLCQPEETKSVPPFAAVPNSSPAVGLHCATNGIISRLPVNIVANCHPRFRKRRKTNIGVAPCDVCWFLRREGGHSVTSERISWATLRRWLFFFLLLFQVSLVRINSVDDEQLLAWCDKCWAPPRESPWKRCARSARSRCGEKGGRKFQFPKFQAKCRLVRQVREWGSQPWARNIRWSQRRWTSWTGRQRPRRSRTWWAAWRTLRQRWPSIRWLATSEMASFCRPKPPKDWRGSSCGSRCSSRVNRWVWSKQHWAELLCTFAERRRRETKP